MSAIIGVDVGAVHCRLAQILPQRKMPVILRNTLSNENTPSIVSYPGAPSSRLYGETALGKELSRPEQTSMVIKQSLSVEPHDAEGIKALRQTGAPIRVTESDGTSVEVVYDFGASGALHPTQVAAYFLRNVLTFATEPILRVAIAAPVGASAKLRGALHDAAVVAGVSPKDVRIVDEADALAVYLHHLHYASLPPTLDDEAVRPILIINSGYSATSVTLIRASQAAVDVVATRGANVGVSSIDTALADRVVSAILAKNKIDMSTHVKSLNKIRRECAKAKVMLSTTDKVSCSFECLKDDIDFAMTLNSSDLEEATEAFSAMVKQLISDVVAAGAVNLSVDGGIRVEMVGNGWRAPIVTAVIKQACNTQRLGTSLDCNMCVAEGAAILGVIELANEHVPLPEGEGAAPNEPPLFDPVHRVVLSRRDGTVLDNASLQYSDDATLQRWIAAENEWFAVDETCRLRIKALNDLETAVFRVKEASAAALTGPDNAAAKHDLDELIDAEEQWIYSAQDGLIDDLTAESVTERTTVFQTTVLSRFPQLAAHWEREKELNAAKDAALAALAKEQDASKELKSDPQRLRGAQEKRDQGVTLFKQEHFEEAHTRFVQALTILGQLYDNTGENKTKRDEIALSCHLNIASCCVKIGHWRIAVNNCTKALEIKPDHPKALFRRGQANAQLQELDAAKSDLSKALELSAGDPAVAAELQALNARIEQVKAKEQKMYSKMFA